MIDPFVRTNLFILEKFALRKPPGNPENAQYEKTFFCEACRTIFGKSIHVYEGINGRQIYVRRWYAINTLNYKTSKRHTDTCVYFSNE